MGYTVKIPSIPQLRGTHYTAGSDYLYFIRNDSSGVNQGVYRTLISPEALIAEGRSVVLTATPNKQVNLNSVGNNDVKWTGTQLVGMFNAKIALVTGVTSLGQITTSQMLAINWTSIPNNNAVAENGASTVGNFYVVRVPAPGGDFNYAKVRVYNSAGPKIEWLTYLASPNPIRVSAVQGDLRDLVVSDYEGEIYLSGVDTLGTHFVGRIARTTAGPYPEYSSLGLMQLNSGMLVEPQQMALDGTNIYVVDDTSVWRIDPNGTQDEVVTGLSGGVGLLLDTTGSGVHAYIADTSGNIRVVNLDTFTGLTPIPAPAPSFSFSGSAGFMRWADDQHTALYIADRGNDEVKRLDLLTGNISTEASTPQAPWGVEAITANRLFVSCDDELGAIDRSIPVSGVLLLGIGLIPFDYINNSAANPSSPAPNDGKANTSSAPGYYFSQYGNLPFGGSLSLMLNHDLAWQQGIRSYRLSLKHVPSGVTRQITSAFTDMRWNPSNTPPRFDPVSTAPTSGMYPIRNPADLWYNPHLSAVIATSVADNGHNVLKIEFFDAAGAPAPGGVFERLLLIDNTRYNARLEFPRIGTSTVAPTAGVYPTLQCGCITYATKDDLVEVDFADWHPQGTGSYSLTFHRGSTHLSNLQQSGAVTMTQVLMTKSEVTPGTPFRVGHLLGNCDIANIQITLNVPSRVIDGFGWVNLSAQLTRSFTLLKGPMTHTPWP